MASSGQIWVRSNSFPVEEGEDSETNNGIYGRSLSRWLEEKLRESGESPLGIVAEDWGRCIILREQPHTFIGCANQWGETTVWGVFVEVKESLGKRLFGDDSARKEVARLHELLQQIFESSAEITEVGFEPA